MNNKDLFILAKVILGGLVLISFLSGCSTSQTQSGLSAKESRMSEEFIRGQVLRYKAEVEKQNEEIDKLAKDCPVYDEYFGNYLHLPI